MTDRTEIPAKLRALADSVDQPYADCACDRLIPALRFAADEIERLLSESAEHVQWVLLNAVEMAKRERESFDAGFQCGLQEKGT